MWDSSTRGYILTTETGKYVANEIRPVFVQELKITGLDLYFDFDLNEKRPVLWARKNIYFLNGEKIAQLNNVRYGEEPEIKVFFDGKMRLEAVDIESMVKKNSEVLDCIIADAQSRTKELFDKDIANCDIAYVAFSGGKDSVALLNLCNEVLPYSVPVIFSDTDMELPDTYDMWEKIQKRYPEREFLKAACETPALENWYKFGPPSRTIRWCCSIHKSTPAIITLKNKLKKSAVKALAFVGVRGEESYTRSFYEDSGDGVKNASQLNRMPLLDWGAHEIWLYIFKYKLPINTAYRFGLPRVGCLMCPEASNKYEWLIDKAYHSKLVPFTDLITETSDKDFTSNQDKVDFIGNSGWQARKSGIILSKNISNPIESNIGLTTIFKSSFFSKALFYEWIKTIGNVVIDRETNKKILELPNQSNKDIPFSFEDSRGGLKIITFNFQDSSQKKELLPQMRAMLRKVSACINCRCCEAECRVGAIESRNGTLTIDGSKCIQCQNCYDIDLSCWRFKSMYKTDTVSEKMSGINRYNNFGLREDENYPWISTLVELENSFFPWTSEHPLGKKMVESASAWFQQAKLVEVKTRKPTKLIELFREKGSKNDLGWELIWIALVNNAVLLKWFVTSTKVDIPYTIKELADLLEEMYPNLGKSIEGGLAALKDMLTKSPLGGENAVTNIEMKGRTVKSITRKAKEIDSLTVLYSLYLISEITGRSSFSIREMLEADITSTYISPIIAFNVPVETFKRQCSGLYSKYPEYISITFEHGNDGMKIFPEKYKSEDVIALALEN